MRAIARYFSALWSGYSEDKERQYELRLIKNWSNVPIDNINIRNIPVSSIEDDTVHCISIVSGDKPSLVIIPGYGASGGFYYKLMEGLSERYNLYIVDMRGMGWYDFFQVFPNFIVLEDLLFQPRVKLKPKNIYSMVLSVGGKRWVWIKFYYVVTQWVDM